LILLCNQAFEAQPLLGMKLSRAARLQPPNASLTSRSRTAFSRSLARSAWRG